MKQGEASLPLLFNFAFECAIKKVQLQLKLSRTRQHLVSADDMNLLRDGMQDNVWTEEK
jgi:hypothetical protein